eukprot:TRINITY_DN11340_c0_g1_i1.p1 TRINITY_DN11340_c0_g1~~TRINITY_DN11340_c0_g1_i1.p1  ORF type:complete len:304 (+),score=26.36 TRINITY_DN11340_c0_g1_i1:118-1029(+)
MCFSEQSDAPSQINCGKVSECLAIPCMSTELDYEQCFQQVSDFLLNRCIFYIKGKPHRILEVEVYFYSEAHPDPYPHNYELYTQYTGGHWYFHRVGNSYKGGNYKGLDISIGRGAEEYGGILIRTVQSLEPEEEVVISGPCRTVDYILRLCGASSIQDLVDNKMDGNTNALSPNASPSKPLHLAYHEHSERREIFRSPRIGLNLNKKGETAESQIKYNAKFYRYFTLPTKVHKKNPMIAALYFAGRTPVEISQITGAKLSTVMKYCECFEKGRKMKPSKFVGTKLNDELFCQFLGATLRPDSS